MRGLIRRSGDHVPGRMEWIPPRLLSETGGDEVDPHGPTASIVPKREASASQANRTVQMKTSRTIVGVDTAKSVFQLYWVDTGTGEMTNVKLTRGKFLEHFANRSPYLIGMEACGGTQHWARRLQALGLEIRIVSAKMVRPFVRGNKSDAHDARAIWPAVSATRGSHGGGEDRGATGGAGAAPHAPAVGEISHRADQLYSDNQHENSCCLIQKCSRVLEPLPHQNVPFAILIHFSRSGDIGSLKTRYPRFHDRLLGWHSAQFAAQFPEHRNGPRKLDSAVSEILHGIQAAKLRLAWPKYTSSGVRRSSAL